MKTKLIPWWENPLRFLATFAAWSVVVFVMVIAMSAFLYDWDAMSAEAGYQISFWTYKTDSIFGMVPFWFVMWFAMQVVAVPLISWVSYFPIVKRRLFRYEINKGLIPYIDGQPVAFPRDEDVDKIEWREPKRFTATIYAGKHNGQNWVWGEDIHGGEYMVLTHTFIDRLDQLDDNSGLRGTWEWKWKRYDFVELVLVEELSELQLELFEA